MEGLHKVNKSRKSVVALIIMSIMSGLANLVGMLNEISKNSGKWDSKYIEQAVMFYEENITARIRVWMHDAIGYVGQHFGINLQWVPSWFPEYIPFAAIFSTSLIYSYCYINNISSASLLLGVISFVKGFFRELLKNPFEAILGLILIPIVYVVFFVLMFVFAPIFLLIPIVVISLGFVWVVGMGSLFYLGFWVYYALFYMALYIFHMVMWAIKMPKQLLSYIAEVPSSIFAFIVHNKREVTTDANVGTSLFSRGVFVIIAAYFVYVLLFGLYNFAKESLIAIFESSWSIAEIKEPWMFVYLGGFIFGCLYYLESKKRAEYAVDVPDKSLPYYIYCVKCFPNDLLKLRNFTLSYVRHIYAYPQKNEIVASAFSMSKNFFALSKLIVLQYAIGFVMMMVVIFLYAYYNSGSIKELMNGGADIYNNLAAWLLAVFVHVKAMLS